ncbi:MAG: phospho-sugar mutase [Oscillospiraceae bacterium]|nr:phospho-sugar mutase [Oscillospiraceae bacterium]
MSYLDTLKLWLGSGVLSDTEMEELKSYSEKEAESRFYGPLEFGTAGLRGKMGLGTAMMNIYVIRHATQAFAKVILDEGEAAAKKGIAICRDCRNNGKEFAEAAACVMAANGIPVRIFEDMRPTPELSFAVRHYGCIAGINVTASHNPKEYNGYKVYWSDGAQLPPAHAAKIAAEMENSDVFTSVKTMDYNEAVNAGLITVMGRETDDAFLENVLAQSGKWSDDELDRDVKIVYTPFHGTGCTLIPEVLKKIGVNNLYCVEEQMIPDGSFSTVESPNPENPEGFELAVKLADKVGADFIIGSDPDADRVGIMIRGTDGKFIPIIGNLTGVLLLDYVAKILAKNGEMPEKPVMLKTIVTTEMARAAAKIHGIECFDTFTGFKFMAEKKNELEETGEGKVIFSYEESYGYMVGDYVRDKDAVSACMLLCEMVMRYSKLGISVQDAIDGLYEKLGFFKEKTLNLYMEGLDGMRAMAALMENLRNNHPCVIAETAVSDISDYKTGTKTVLSSGEVSKIELSGSNVLRFALSDETVILVRPSGTEPKVKVYILTKSENLSECDERIEKYSNWAETLK